MDKQTPSPEHVLPATEDRWNTSLGAPSSRLPSHLSNLCQQSFEYWCTSCPSGNVDARTIMPLQPLYYTRYEVEKRQAPLLLRQINR